MVRTRNKIQVISLHGGGYRILHHRLEKAVERYDLSQDENAARFTMLMRKYKVEDLLEAAGAKEGDQITIGPKDFIFYPDYYPSSSRRAPKDLMKMPPAQKQIRTKNQ